MTTARTIPPLRSLSADRWMLPIIKTVMQLKQKSNIAMAKPNVIDQDQEVLRKEPGSFTAALPWSRAASRYNDHLAKRRPAARRFEEEKRCLHRESQGRAPDFQP
jgi:hypothetical protein